MMRNISVRIPVTRHGKTYFVGDCFDMAIGETTARVRDKCPSACALMVHCTTTQRFHNFKNPLTALATTLKERKRLEHVTIVALSKPSQMAEHGQLFPFADEVQYQQLSQWPQISVTRPMRLLISDLKSITKPKMESLGCDTERTGICVGTWRRRRSVEDPRPYEG